MCDRCKFLEAQVAERDALWAALRDWISHTYDVTGEDEELLSEMDRLSTPADVVRVVVDGRSTSAAAAVLQTESIELQEQAEQCADPEGREYYRDEAAPLESIIMLLRKIPSGELYLVRRRGDHG
jgi:hypothetical protein